MIIIFSLYYAVIFKVSPAAITFFHFSIKFLCTFIWFLLLTLNCLEKSRTTVILRNPWLLLLKWQRRYYVVRCGENKCNAFKLGNLFKILIIHFIRYLFFTASNRNFNPPQKVKQQVGNVISICKTYDIIYILYSKEFNHLFSVEKSPIGLRLFLIKILNKIDNYYDVKCCRKFLNYNLT